MKCKIRWNGFIHRSLLLYSDQCDVNREGPFTTHIHASRATARERFLFTCTQPALMSSQQKYTIAIMGTGMVGGALDRYFRSHRSIRVGLYDPPKGLNDVSVLARAEIIFVAVPTPFDPVRESFDETFLHQAVRAVPGSGKTIVFKSTVLPGTTDRFQDTYLGHRFLFNPEFLTEATADQDMTSPNRQLLGVTRASEDDADTVLSLLPEAPFRRIMSARTAETVKYFCNAFYALKVTYANQLYDLCTELGVDYDVVRECVEPEPMMGRNHLQIFHAGYRGYGGKCLPKDTRALIRLGDAMGVDLTLLKAAERYNTTLQLAQTEVRGDVRPSRRPSSLSTFASSPSAP